MKRYIGLFLVLVTFSCYGQKKHNEPSKNDDLETMRWRKTNKISYGTIKKKFPFNKAASIVLVAFDPPPLRVPEIVDPGDKERPQPQFPKKGIDTFGHKNVREVIVLKEAQQEQLASLFYNLMCPSNTWILGACYDPRNAILFLDKNGHVAAELEICFECHNYETKPNNFFTGVMCRGRYDAIQKFLADAGIKYGVSNEQ